MRLMVLAMFNQHNSKQLREKVKRGQLGAAFCGTTIGRVPLGDKVVPQLDR
jgi:DNA invertase Pin-like site-specific DNA recombinase